MNATANHRTSSRFTEAISGRRRREESRHRISATSVVVALVLGALAALVPGRPAGAAPAVTSGGSIAYVKDANVWLTSPDGVTKRQVTTDGAVASSDNTGSGPYLAPSRSDTGDVLVAFRNEGRTDDPLRLDPYLWVMDRQGAVIRKFRRSIHARERLGRQAWKRRATGAAPLAKGWSHPGELPTPSCPPTASASPT